jgi:hypothetical protein
VPVINNQTLINSPIVIRSLGAELSYNQNQCSVHFILAQRYSNYQKGWILPERFTRRLLPLCTLVKYQFSLLKQNTHLHIFLVTFPVSIFSSKCGEFVSYRHLSSEKLEPGISSVSRSDPNVPLPAMHSTYTFSCMM